MKSSLDYIRVIPPQCCPFLPSNKRCMALFYIYAAISNKDNAARMFNTKSMVIDDFYNCGVQTEVTF